MRRIFYPVSCYVLQCAAWKVGGRKFNVSIGEAFGKLLEGRIIVRSVRKESSFEYQAHELADQLASTSDI